MLVWRFIAIAFAIARRDSPRSFTRARTTLVQDDNNF